MLEEEVVVVEGFFHQMVEVEEDQQLFQHGFSLIYVVSFYVSEIFLKENKILNEIYFNNILPS
jgi:hypothetical protein